MGIGNKVLPSENHLRFAAETGCSGGVTKNSHVLDGCLVGVIRILDSARLLLDRRICSGNRPAFGHWDLQVWHHGPVHERRIRIDENLDPCSLLHLSAEIEKELELGWTTRKTTTALERQLPKNFTLSQGFELKGYEAGIYGCSKWSSLPITKKNDCQQLVLPQKKKRPRNRFLGSFCEEIKESKDKERLSMRTSLPTTKKLPSPCQKRRRSHTKPLYGGFLRRNKKERKHKENTKKKIVNEEFFFSRSLRRGLKFPSK